MELILPSLSLNFQSSDGDPGFSLNIPSITLQTGKLTFLMGHNGSGKSLFLKLLAGEIRSSHRGGEGSVLPSQIAFVRQQAELSLATDLTVRENFLLRDSPSRLAEFLFPSRLLSRHVESLLTEHPELARKLDQPCRNLSVGQRQTLAFLVVSSRKSALLLLDEFLAATDRSTSRRLRRLAHGYAERTPASVIVVSHDISLSLEEADRILVFKQGNLLKDLRTGSPEWDEKHLAEYISN